MDAKNDQDLRALMQRFDAGDRSPELLLQLDLAAFEAFHAPWETRPSKEDPQRPFHTKLLQGRLPMDEDGEAADETDESPHLNFLPPIGPQHSEKYPLPPPSDEDEESTSGPLETLDSALNCMGRLAYHAPERGLMVDLAYDLRGDFQSQFSFRADWEGQCLQLISRSDLPLSGLCEQDLRRICHTYNHRESAFQAKIYRPEDGSRPRLRLITTIPFTLTRSVRPLLNHLAELFRKDTLFWRMVQSRRPI